MRKIPDGVTLYDGPSMYNGKPIVVIATGLRFGSRNRKTGNMVQVWVLVRDEHPNDAMQNRRDASICGGCPHRMTREGTRRCYVNLGRQGVFSVWHAFRRGKYPLVSDLSLIGKNQFIRVGAYGDPAAVPSHVWAQLLSGASGWTGYTHGWRKFPELKQWFQASVDSEQEFFEAAQQGWGTFRVKPTESDMALKNEIICPATDEGGGEATCRTCLKCDGNSHIVTTAHGTGKRGFLNLRQLPVLQS